LSVPVLPGAATATEIQRARRAGLRVVKFFPAETLGGVRALDALSAPFPDMRFIPTGGINPGNLQPYLARSVVLAVGGSWMVPRELIANRDWAQVTRLARDAAGRPERAAATGPGSAGYGQPGGTYPALATPAIAGLMMTGLTIRPGTGETSIARKEEVDSLVAGGARADR
jgi:hypothetical protein